MFTCKTARKVAAKMAEDNISLTFTKDFADNGMICDIVAFIHELSEHLILLERSEARLGRSAEIRKVKSLIYFIENGTRLYYDGRTKSHHTPWSPGYKKLSIYALPLPPSLT